MTDLKCAGCGVDIGQRAFEGFCFGCYVIVHNPEWIKFQQDQRALEQPYLPEFDLQAMEAKLSRLADMVNNLQGDLTNLFTSVQRYEKHYKEARGESR